MTATLWIVLLITQNWSAHRGRWKLHALSGIGSMALVPVFTVGGLLVTQNTLLKDTAFKEMFGEALSAADFFVSATFTSSCVSGFGRKRRSYSPYVTDPGQRSQFEPSPALGPHCPAVATHLPESVCFWPLAGSVSAHASLYGRSANDLRSWAVTLVDY